MWLYCNFNSLENKKNKQKDVDDHLIKDIWIAADNLPLSPYFFSHCFSIIA